MFTIDETRLNPLERTILTTLGEYAQSNPAPKIVQAARICGCSVSQVSKAVKKAGFPGYKHYIRHLYFDDQPATQQPDEIERLKLVLSEFDVRLVDEFVALIRNHEKIVLFGYGPSLICAQYFEYKLRLTIDSFIATLPDETSVRNLMDDGALLVIMTTTGQYRSFEDVSAYAKAQGAEVVVVSEEFNSALMEGCDRYFVLSHHKQPDTLRPYEKTRTVFFIFFEEVVRRLMESHPVEAAEA